MSLGNSTAGHFTEELAAWLDARALGDRLEEAARRVEALHDRVLRHVTARRYSLRLALEAGDAELVETLLYGPHRNVRIAAARRLCALITERARKRTPGWKRALAKAGR